MRIYSGLDEINGFKNAVVTTGTFDGVHKGHQKILQRLSALAHKIGGETVIITLWPHPRLVLNPDFDLKLLTTIDEKAILLEQFDIDHLIRIPFTEEFSNLSYEEYIKNILVSKIGTRKLVIGHDHRFGKDRLGKFDDLIKYGSQLGFQVVEIPKPIPATITAPDRIFITDPVVDGPPTVTLSSLDFSSSLRLALIPSMSCC